jgi:4-alpha-glucanotransferase
MSLSPTRTTVNVHVGGRWRPAFKPTFQILQPAETALTSYITIAEDVQIITDDAGYLMDLADVIQEAITRLNGGTA